LLFLKPVKNKKQKLLLLTVLVFELEKKITVAAKFHLHVFDAV